MLSKKVVLSLMFLLISCSSAAENWLGMRMDMLDEIQADMRSLMGRPLSPAVAEAMKKVERHEFVPSSLRRRAYENRPLPIGRDQTISQPFIVALMSDLLSLPSEASVLEIGTGSGYQAAVLAELCNAVYTIEIISSLAFDAESRLDRLGYRNVKVHHGDGMLGWPENAPFDGIIVTAAGLNIPDTLISQLKTGGKLVMPVGEFNEVQQLKVIEKTIDGVAEHSVIPVRFVPITHELR